MEKGAVMNDAIGDVPPLEKGGNKMAKRLNENYLLHWEWLERTKVICGATVFDLSIMKPLPTTGKILLS